MRIVRQLFWVIFFSLLGEILSLIIKPLVAIPASVIGMVLLFGALHYKVIQMDQVEDVGNFLTSNMAFLFVPSGVGLMTNLDVFADLWWQYVIIVAVSVVVLLGLVGRLIQTLNVRKSQIIEKENSAAAAGGKLEEELSTAKSHDQISDDATALPNEARVAGQKKKISQNQERSRRKS